MSLPLISFQFPAYHVGPVIIAIHPYNWKIGDSYLKFTCVSGLKCFQHGVINLKLLDFIILNFYLQYPLTWNKKKTMPLLPLSTTEISILRLAIFDCSRTQLPGNNVSCGLLLCLHFTTSLKVTKDHKTFRYMKIQSLNCGHWNLCKFFTRFSLTFHEKMPYTCEICQAWKAEEGSWKYVKTSRLLFNQFLGPK